jgi:hypothetical protein
VCICGASVATRPDDLARVLLRFRDDRHETRSRHRFATSFGHDQRSAGETPMAGNATTVTVAEDSSALVLTITGPLDAAGGRLVHDAAAAALDAEEQRIVEVDLRAAAPLTVDGLRALARCAAFGRVRFRFGAP